MRPNPRVLPAALQKAAAAGSAFRLRHAAVGVVPTATETEPTCTTIATGCHALLSTSASAATCRSLGLPTAVCDKLRGDSGHGFDLRFVRRHVRKCTNTEPVQTAVADPVIARACCDDRWVGVRARMPRWLATSIKPRLHARNSCQGLAWLSVEEGAGAQQEGT